MPADNTARDLTQSEEPSYRPAHHAKAQPREKEVTYTTVHPQAHPAVRVLLQLLTFIFVVTVITVCGYETYTLKQKRDALQQQASELSEEIQVEKADTIQSQIDRSYYNSDQYKEDMARNRFRLVYPGEYLIQIDE